MMKYQIRSIILQGSEHYNYYTATMQVAVANDTENYKVALNEDESIKVKNVLIIVNTYLVNRKRHM